MLIGKARSCPFHSVNSPLTSQEPPPPGGWEKIQSDFKYSRLNDYKLSVHEVRGVGDRQVGYEVLCGTGTSERRRDFIPNCSERRCFGAQFTATTRQIAVCLPLVSRTA